jgi:dihydropteroate synthase
MGIVNVTPDSFFPESRTQVQEKAIARGLELFAAGCDIVDIGGESTRPGATPVSEEEELLRVVPVVAALSRHGVTSIDTQKEAVARECVKAGASIINDVSATLLNVAAELGVGYVAMHRQGDSRVMQDDPHYQDVVTEVHTFLEQMASEANALGVSPLWLDPGIGFGKSVEHNLSLLAHVDDLVVRASRHNAGVLIGTSRKRFLAHLGERELDVDQRLEGSIASEAWALTLGATTVRVHDAQSAQQLRDLLVTPIEEVVA